MKKNCESSISCSKRPWWINEKNDNDNDNDDDDNDDDNDDDESLKWRMNWNDYDIMIITIYNLKYSLDDC